MCSLYSINNSSKFAGQSTFQVVLCAKGSDGNNGSKGYYSAHSSSCSSASWSTSCSHSRRKKMKGVAGTDANMKASAVVLSSSPTQHQSKDVIQNCNLFNPPSFQSHQNHHQRISFSASHYPPLGRTPPSAQPFQQHQHRRRQGSNSYGNTHWHQFHQHNQLHSFDTTVEYEQHDNHRHQSHVYPQKRASWSSDWQQNSSESNSLKDSGNRRSFPILNSAGNTQFHSKSHPLDPIQPSTTPFPQASCPSPALSPSPAPVPAPAPTPAPAPNLSRTAEPAIISFAAAVTAATASASSVPSAKYASASSIAPAEMPSTRSSYFETKDNCGSMPVPLSTISTVDSLSNSTAGQCVDVTLEDLKVPQHSQLFLNRAVEDNDGLSPLGSSVESNSNDTFDGDSMDSHQSSVTDEIDSGDASSDFHSPHDAETTTAEAARASTLLSNHPLPLQRKSRLRQKVDRLKSKNSALQSTVNQMRSDLARERQMRSTIDEIYLKIKNDLNQRLENEELKNFNLAMEMEQMATEMKDLKDQLATYKASTSASSTATRCSPVTGYRIGYDNSSFSLSNGISNIEGLMLHSQSHPQSTLIDGQDDSEEFLLSHSYSPSVVQSTQSASAVSTPIRTATSTFMSCSEDEDEDENMTTDHSDDESDRDIKSLAFNLTQSSRSDSHGASVSLATSLPTLIEEEDAEGMEESDDEGEPCEEHDDAPRTMMEMIIQRQMAHAPEDDMENPPADADETFETMAQSLLYQAIPSRFTVAQMHMQLEDLMAKYGACLDQTVDVLAKELSRWWEVERLAVGGPVAGGWGSETVVINEQTGERANPKVAVEKRIETFFGPLFLQFIATSSEQMLLLEKLELYAHKDASWLRNHNAVLVALYKFDVVETEAILEWWRGLETPRDIFGHDGNNLRSLNSKFVAWLEDEDDSDSEEEEEEEDDEDEDYESDSEFDEEDDSDDDDDDDNDDEDCDYSNDDATKLEQVMADRGEDSASSDSNSRPASNASSLPTSPTPPTSLSKQTTQGEGSNNTNEEINSVMEPKRRISFCTNNNMYYSQDGTVCSEKNLTSGGTETSNETEDKMSSKKYVQCPPFVALDEDDNSEDSDENASVSMGEGDEGAKDTTADNDEE